MDMNLSKLQEIAEDREAWWAAIHGVAKSWTQLKWLNNKYSIQPKRLMIISDVPLHLSKIHMNKTNFLPNDCKT